MDFFWWINNIGDSLSPIQTPNCSFLLKTNASKSGWVQLLIKKPLVYTLH